MYSRNTVARKKEQENCENCNHYRYSIPPRYDGNRFRQRDKGEVVALPDSAFSGIPVEEPSFPQADEEKEISEILCSADVYNETVPGTYEEKREEKNIALEECKESSLRLAERIKSDDLMLIVVLFVLFLESGGENCDLELLFFLALLLCMGGSR